MSIIDKLVEQCREPKGLLGNIMIKSMNLLDVGLTNWSLQQINHTKGNILDIGCGGGKTVHALSKAFPDSKVYGIDCSEEAVKMSIKRNKNKINEGKIDIVEASVLSIPFTDHYFKHIVAIRTHYFWPGLKQSIQEVYRVLDKGGQFLILSELYKISYHMKEYNTNASLTLLLKQSGFETVKILEKSKCICVIATKN